MIKAMVFLMFLVSIESTQNSLMESGSLVEKKKRSTSRGYYGYPVVPYAEPLTILAGLAFLAYIIQVFHSLYFQHHGLGGGVLNNVLPGKARNSFLETNETDKYQLKD